MNAKYVGRASKPVEFTTKEGGIININKCITLYTIY